eukprot:m.128072 g.128072  ORF g.128072 m.128072 type:complete len:64 (+) comp13018_c1_seq1:50-241(+)
MGKHDVYFGALQSLQQMNASADRIKKAQTSLLKLNSDVVFAIQSLEKVAEQRRLSKMAADKLL